MLETEEIKVTPPRFPLTIAINQAIADFYFNYFMNKYLPQYGYRITSTTRSPADNIRVGGASNSAHLHGLAIDFVLMEAGTGKNVTRGESQNIFNSIIKPKWPGFALWESDHIHVNLSRKIGTAANLLAISVMGVVGVTIFKNWRAGKDGK